jgi:hypothetical protein
MANHIRWGTENYSGQIELIDPTVSFSLVLLSLMCMYLLMLQRQNMSSSQEHGGWG